MLKNERMVLTTHHVQSAMLAGALHAIPEDKLTEEQKKVLAGLDQEKTETITIHTLEDARAAKAAKASVNELTIDEKLAVEGFKNKIVNEHKGGQGGHRRLQKQDCQ